MSDDMFSQGKLFKLCQAAPINKELLLKFVQDKMIIEGDIEQIMAQDSNFNKAKSLHSFLQRRPSSDQPRILKHLKNTTNVAPAVITEGTDITRDAALSSLAKGFTSLKTDMSEIKQCLNLLMEKVENIDNRIIDTEKTLKALTNSGFPINALEEINVLPEQNLQKGDSFTQKESPFVLDVSTLPNGPGSIVFDGNSFDLRRRRFWVLEKAGTIKFTVVKNDFSPGSRITISGFKTTEKWDSKGFLDEVYINSSTAKGTDFTVSGVVILVTLTSNNTDGKGLTSSFNLSFIHEKNDLILIPGRILQPSTFVTEEGQTVASFPERNAVSYENNANHFMLISRPNRLTTFLTQTFTDTEKEKHYSRKFFIQDDAEKTKFGGGEAISGRDGRVNLNWGQTSAWVLFFSSDGSGSGRGYEFKIE